MKKSMVAVAMCATLAMLAGCTTTQYVGTPVATPSGHMQTISIVDSSERIKLSTKVSLSDIIAFAENLTNKMLQSKVIAKAKKKGSSCIVVGEEPFRQIKSLIEIGPGRFGKGISIAEQNSKT